MRSRHYNGVYRKERLDRVAFPMGGIGAGMICLEGSGALSHVSLRHKPDIGHEPPVFGALSVQAGQRRIARVLEGPVPSWKCFGGPGAGNGGQGKHGLPRFEKAEFEARFPFATVRLEDRDLPIRVEITGWSPFTPGDADSSSLPVAALEYRLVNAGRSAVNAVFSFHAQNFMKMPKGEQAVLASDGGFVLHQSAKPEEPHFRGDFAVSLLDAPARVNCRWFRGGWFDALTMLWKTIEAGEAPEHPPFTEGAPGPGGSVAVPLRLGRGESRVIRLLLAWHVPDSDLRQGKEFEADGGGGAAPGKYRPWYAARFAGIGEMMAYWRAAYDDLRTRSAWFRDCFYDTSLPPEAIEAVAANLTILKSPTVLRQTDGRLWAWEGCCDGSGCCPGTCNHVWNYAQALPHLFPELERSLRQTEFNECQNEAGHQTFRASLPIRPPDHGFHAAADGQLGGIMKVYRDWRTSGDTNWLRRLWPKVKQSLLYCIETWDPDHTGTLVEPHHTTFDIEFWGADGMCTSFYLGALKAAAAMAAALADDVPLFAELYRKGRRFMEKSLWNGEYFIQKVQWKGLRAGDPTKFMVVDPVPGAGYSPEARELLERLGPKYQYDNGCLSDGVLGAWMAAVCGVGEILDRRRVRGHALAVYRHNFRRDLFRHVNPQRPGYALGHEGGLLVCSWPRGEDVSVPLVYGNEVWTGVEYQAASHLIMLGQVAKGLEIVRAARDRYDGRVRNPFNEYECGHWYARAMSSYALLQALSGARYDAVEKTLHLAPRLKGDFRAFFAADGWFGTVGVRAGRPFVEVRSGEVEIKRIRYRRPK